MQIKSLNSYRITHENGSVENINAENIVEAIENTEISESYSPIVQVFLEKKNVKSVIPSETPPEEVPDTPETEEETEGQ